MSGDPAYVSHAGELVVRVHIEDILDRKPCAENISAGGMYHTLGTTGRSGSLYKFEEKHKIKLPFQRSEGA